MVIHLILGVFTVLALGRTAMAADDYLIHATFRLPTDGRAMITTKPLEPYRWYMIRVRTPYNLRPLLRWSGGNRVNGDHLLLFNGKRLASNLWGDWRQEILTLTYWIRGKGEPLSIRAADNISLEVPWMDISIESYSLLLSPDFLLPVGLSVVGVFLLVVLGSALSARRRQHMEEAEIQHQLDCARQAQEAELRRQEEAEENLRRQEEEQEAKRRAEQRRQEQAREAERQLTLKRQTDLHHRARALAQAAHLERDFGNADYRYKFAIKHRQALLADLGNTYFAEWQNVRRDKELLDVIPQYDKEYGVDTLQWLEDRLETLREAHRLDVEPPLPAKPQLSPIDIQARIERFRQRKLQRVQTKVDDMRASIIQHIEDRQEFIQDLNARGLDPDEIDRHLAAYDRAFLEASAAQEENANGQHRHPPLASDDQDGEEEILRPQ